MRGLYGEEVPFFAHLEAQSKSTRWLKLLEGIMKNTMATILQACVQAKMEDSESDVFYAPAMKWRKAYRFTLHHTYVCVSVHVSVCPSVTLYSTVCVSTSPPTVFKVMV